MAMMHGLRKVGGPKEKFSFKSFNKILRYCKPFMFVPVLYYSLKAFDILYNKAQSAFPHK